MPDELQGDGVEVVQGGEASGGGLGVPLGGSDEIVAADAVQDELGTSCEGRVDQLESENASLRSRVAELEGMLAGVERRFELERALMDAGVVDLETALAVADSGSRSDGDVISVVSAMVESKPFLFRSRGSGVVGSAMGGASVDTGSTLSGLADEARRSGDRRSLTRYLRKRRQG